MTCPVESTMWQGFMKCTSYKPDPTYIVVHYHNIPSLCDRHLCNTVGQNWLPIISHVVGGGHEVCLSPPKSVTSLHCLKWEMCPLAKTTHLKAGRCALSFALGGGATVSYTLCIRLQGPCWKVKIEYVLLWKQLPLPLPHVKLYLLGTNIVLASLYRLTVLNPTTI